MLLKILHILYSYLYLVRYGRRYFAQLEQPLQGKLDEATLTKALERYALHIPMTCDAFTQLYGRNTNKSEKERMLLYYVSTVIYDDFFDLKQLSTEDQEKITLHGLEFEPRNFNEKLFVYMQKALLPGVHQPEEHLAVFGKLLRNQQDSAKQFDAAVSDSELERITLQKGGWAYQMCFYYLDLNIDERDFETTKRLWYQIGGIIQLINDLYDIRKDMLEGIVTLPYRMKDVNAYWDYYHQTVQTFFAEVDKLHVPKSRKKKFIQIMRATTAFGYLGLEQFKDIQGNNPQMPPMESLTRQQLVVDMAKSKNWWRWLKHYYWT